REHDVCLYAHRWTPDPDVKLCFHRVPVLPWPGIVRFLSFFASASLAVRRGGRRHGGYDGIYSPGANCRQVSVSTAWFCQARQLAMFRSGRHRPRPASMMDWLKFANRWLFARVTSEVERRFYRSERLERVIAQSRLLAGDLAHFYGVPESKLEVAHGGVNAGTFDPAERMALRPRVRAELGLPDGRFVFFFIGNNWLIKGLYHVLRALAEVPGVLLAVVGADVERRESWEQFSRELGVADRILYLPRRKDVIAYYAAADALLAPSVYDTFPLMPMEAMACGLPVIISARTGVAEIVGPEDALVVSNPENTPELAAAMRRMADDAGLRARLVKNGRALAERNPWDRIQQAVARELCAQALDHLSSNGHRH
ncbi:MAG TPA: glycosyltransferase family 4 protein, partial [Candidatus Acidoferrales bacterium]|nr:glycosyltransferase family 4 protein [Candidatus Acidoferrales bacterium]